MKTFLKEAKLILLFFVVLTAASIFSNLDFEVKTNNSSIVSPKFNVIVKPNLDRAPAATNEKESLTLEKQFFCNSAPKTEQDKVSKRMVMLNFKICHEAKNIRDVLIKNESNGFKAQIFSLESNKFKTDYIQLNEGVNKLKLEAVLKDGQKIVESLEILSGS